MVFCFFLYLLQEIFVQKVPFSSTVLIYFILWFMWWSWSFVGVETWVWVTQIGHLSWSLHMGAILNNSCIVCLTLNLITMLLMEMLFSVELVSSSSLCQIPFCASFSLAQSGSIYLSVDINWCCICFILYLFLPFLPFHPSCHLCHLFLGYPHSHPLLGAHRDQVCQAGPVTRGHCRSDAVLLSVWSQAAVQRHSGIDRLLPSTPTSSDLWMQTENF